MISLRRLAIVLASLPAWQGLAAALPDGSLIQSDIYAGQQSKPGAFPYIVTLVLGGYQNCDGVLIDANTVLTAASCSHLKAYVHYRVRAGSLVWNDGGVVARVAHFLPHPDYDPVRGGSDIALWRLANPIEQSSTISYVTLPPANAGDLPVGTNVIIAGWGATNYTANDTPTYLQQATVPVAPSAACQTKFKADNVTMDPTMFCVGNGSDKGGQPGACAGDQGGPLVCATTGTFWGIMSEFSDDCGEPEHYDIYTKVTKFVDWINKNKF